VPPFSLKGAAAAVAAWLIVGFWIAWEMLDDDWGHAAVDACVILAGSGAASHAGLISFERFRALAGRGRITAVCIVTMLVFALVRAVRGSTGTGSIVVDVLLAFVPALAMSALAVYVVERLDGRRASSVKPSARSSPRKPGKPPRR